MREQTWGTGTDLLISTRPLTAFVDALNNVVKFCPWKKKKKKNLPRLKSFLPCWLKCFAPMYSYGSFLRWGLLSLQGAKTAHVRENADESQRQLLRAASHVRQGVAPACHRVWWSNRWFFQVLLSTCHGAMSDAGSLREVWDSRSLGKVSEKDL